jgi:protein-tyrosine phosphatase
VFQDFVQKAGLDESILVDSAGTLGYHAGSLPDSRMQSAATRRGYTLNSFARQVTQDDIDNFDLIVPMDHDNFWELTTIAGKKTDHIRLLGSFIEPNKDILKVKPVPDPYYGGAAGFEYVLDMIETACPAMLGHCLESISKIE